MKKNVTQDLFFERNVTQKKRHTVAKKKKKKEMEKKTIKRYYKPSSHKIFFFLVKRHIRPSPSECPKEGSKEKRKKNK